MPLDQVILAIFTMLIGFGSLYLSFKRNAIVWSIIATVLFSVNVLFGMSIPFVIDASGATVPTSANTMITGMNLIFTFIGLFKSLFSAFDFFKAEK